MAKIEGPKMPDKVDFSSKNPRVREIKRILRKAIKAIEAGHKKAVHSTLPPFKTSCRDAGLSGASFNFFLKC